MKLALLNNWRSKVWIVFLVSTPDRVGAIQTRHHLLRWGEGVHEETTCLFAEWWVLSKYNSFDHFPSFVLILIPWNRLQYIFRPTSNCVLGAARRNHNLLTSRPSKANETNYRRQKNVNFKRNSQLNGEGCNRVRWTCWLLLFISNILVYFLNKFRQGIV